MLGFIAGSVLASFHMPFWWGVPSLGVVTLGKHLGWVAAVALQLTLFVLIAWGVRRLEQRRCPLGVATSPAQPIWQVVLYGPWSYMAGAVGLALLNVLTLLLASHPWTITWAFALWGAKVLQAFGYNVSHTPFWSGAFQQRALAAPVFADAVSVMNLGIMLGACLAAGLAGRFAPTWRLPWRLIATALGGGLMLGYGARIAFGCNIGAYFSGVASTSLHGWLWLLGALFGTPIGVKLRALWRPD